MISPSHRIVALSAAFAALAFGSPSHAETSQDEQVWLQIVAQGPVAGKVVYLAELQPRFGDRAKGLSQMVIRGAVGVKISDRVTIYQGYANARTPVAGRTDTVENRSFQQISWALGNPGGVALTSRTRLEQRWFSTGDEVGWRLRGSIRAAVPVRADGKIKLIGSVEVFVALDDTDWGARSGLDRVRGFAGVELPFSGKSTVELGYLNQYVNGANGRDQMDHVAAINLVLRP
ncbi:DUF2490 domain-containing protein [Novosphingobium sp. G106]|uniref:DUF2490 domain-containing protein n=1 Tax=Novosphingobium sp. G106 TaxID=2849500 RepID=UPI001C2D751B|nr:DUF2490 domain-containing protein [Novosphingobium sp. G106]MBV1687016.1 DUF2490 domain-containing protein [Novosphingobium sp. G106]